MRIGAPALAWQSREADRLRVLRPDPAEPLSWAVLAQEFLAGETTLV
jgi:hypothetical protein